MARQRHLTKAPIREALIDIRIKTPAGLELASLDALHAAVDKDYPTKTQRTLVKTTLEVKDGKAKPPEIKRSAPHGYWFRSGDEKVFQARLDGFTFNRMKPYPSWESFRDEAARLWKLYADVVKPDLITRVALRFINEVELPASLADLSKYVTIPPPVPPGLGGPINSFLSTAVFLDETDASCNLTSALEPSPKGSGWVYILDIDVFKGGEAGIDEKEAWREIDQLRILKNRIFFDSITEETASLYE